MDLVEKCLKLTPEQREELVNVKDLADLNAFVSKHSIELSEEELLPAQKYIEHNKLPLSDYDLDMVAGGQHNYTNHCYFYPDLSYQYEKRYKEIYLLCDRHPCDCQCCCKGTSRCIEGKHHVINVGRNEYTAYPKGEYNHISRHYIYIPK